MKKAAMNLKAIGFVRNGITSESPKQNWAEVISEIVVHPELTEALDNLEEFSHIKVLFRMTRVNKRNISYKVHPRGNPDLPLVGLFATRSPDRPNPVGEMTAKLLERRGNILKVQGLDAFNGTEVIDIKPYMPGYDSVKEAQVPQWVKKIQKQPY